MLVGCTASVCGNILLRTGVRPACRCPQHCVSKCWSSHIIFGRVWLGVSSIALSSHYLHFVLQGDSRHIGFAPCDNRILCCFRFHMIEDHPSFRHWVVHLNIHILEQESVVLQQSIALIVAKLFLSSMLVWAFMGFLWAMGDWTSPCTQHASSFQKCKLYKDLYSL
jgi:hypothetical protein